MEKIPKFKKHIKEIRETITDFSIIDRTGWTIEQLERQKKKYPLKFMIYKVILSNATKGEAEIIKKNKS